MDVCCSPGGFSEYVLENNKCRGVGLSLPLDLGGHVPAIDTDNLATPQRYYGQSVTGVRMSVDGFGMEMFIFTPASSLHIPRYHMHFYDVTTVADRIRCEDLYGSKKPKDCLRVLKPGGMYGGGSVNWEGQGSVNWEGQGSPIIPCG